MSLEEIKDKYHEKVDFIEEEDIEANDQNISSEIAHDIKQKMDVEIIFYENFLPFCSILKDDNKAKTFLNPIFDIFIQQDGI